MDCGLQFWRRPPRERVGVKIAEQENELKKEQACIPNAGNSTKPWKICFATIGWTRKIRAAENTIGTGNKTRSSINAYSDNRFTDNSLSSSAVPPFGLDAA